MPLCSWLPQLGILMVNYHLMRALNARRSQTQVLSALNSSSSNLVTSKGRYSTWLFRSFTINSIAPSMLHINLINRLCAAHHCFCPLHTPCQAPCTYIIRCLYSSLPWNSRSNTKCHILTKQIRNNPCRHAVHQT